MYIRNGKRFNIYAQATINGVTYPHFEDATIRDTLGITWIDDPLPPEDFSYDTYYRTEQDDAPYVVYTRKSDEQIARLNDTKARDAAQKHLDDTEYLFNIDRHAELIASEPEREAALRASRAAARQVIREYKVKYPEAV